MEVVAEFVNCPKCEEDHRLMHGIVKDQIENDNMGEKAIGCTDIKVYCNIDPTHIPIVGGRVPGARVYFDMCTKCGKIYTVRIEKGHVSIPSTPGLPPEFT